MTALIIDHGDQTVRIYDPMRKYGTHEIIEIQDLDWDTHKHILTLLKNGYYCEMGLLSYLELDAEDVNVFNEEADCSEYDSDNSIE